MEKIEHISEQIYLHKKKKNQKLDFFSHYNNICCNHDFSLKIFKINEK